MRTADFSFDLPPELIAQKPASARDESRLLVLHRLTGKIEHRIFSELLDYLKPSDVLVLNNSRVIPARLRGINKQTKGNFEILLLEEVEMNEWWALVQPGKRARHHTTILLISRNGLRREGQFLKGHENVSATVLDKNSEGHCRLRFHGVADIKDALDEFGEVPLPPYIRRAAGELPEDRERYQTVFAGADGSVAAPTAGLHFTNSLLEQIRARGVEICYITLHVGLGTFLPVKSENLAGHTMHEERYELSASTADTISRAKTEKRRIIAIGTTTVRVLESVAKKNSGRLLGETGRTKIFIHPPYDFQIVDGLLTNFHLPCSTLLMLAGAFAAPGETRGREIILSAYAEAIQKRYRFFSYGDAMLVI